jgi:membrane carboxypeptidase/penicillin-binding protein PbpC
VRTVFPTQEGKPYVPQDYDLRFHGPVTVRAALANSYNVPAVKALQYIGVEALIDQAARQGINWVADLGFRPAYGAAASAPDPTGGAGQPWIQVENPQSFGLALTLGGGEVRLLDLTAAYAAFANGGRRVTPYAIERIETLAGEPVEETTGSRPAGSGGQEGGATPARAVDPRVAYLITDILSDGDARLPAFGPGNVLDIGRPAAAKTGTTTDWRDNWTLGYTPDLAAGVWVGNADNTPMLDISGISGAGPIWHDFMVNVLRNVPARQFARPDGLVQVEVCADSGLLPGVERDWASRAANSGASARSGGASASATATTATRTVSPAAAPCPARRPEWFIAGTEPQAVDRAHLQVPIDVRTGQPASKVTPADALGYQMVWALPAEYQAWARENSIAQPAGLATADLADVGTAHGGSGPAGQPASLLSRAPAPLALASPDPNRSYKLDPGLPAEAQKLPVTAMPGRELLGEGSAITLLLDGSPFATVAGPDYTAWWQLATGEHTFQAAGRRADDTQITSPVVSIYVEH